MTEPTIHWDPMTMNMHLAPATESEKVFIQEIMAEWERVMKKMPLYYSRDKDEFAPLL